MKKLIVLLTAVIISFSVNAQITVWKTDKETGAKIVSASLYGAKPNDGKSDKAALKFLIRKVSAMPNTYIALEPGKYDVKKLHIDYEILQDMNRVSDTTPTPEGYDKMLYIFLIPKNTDVVMNVK